MAQRVPFIVAELGRDADPFMLHLYAAQAEKERRREWYRYSRSTRSAVQPDVYRLHHVLFTHLISRYAAVEDTISSV
jgi:hypothetical protein